MAGVMSVHNSVVSQPFGGVPICNEIGKIKWNYNEFELPFPFYFAARLTQKVNTYP